jgi:hypothetical protein
MCLNQRTDTFRAGQRPGLKSADAADAADARVRGSRLVKPEDLARDSKVSLRMIRRAELFDESTL